MVLNFFNDLLVSTWLGAASCSKYEDCLVGSDSRMQYATSQHMCPNYCVDKVVRIDCSMSLHWDSFHEFLMYLNGRGKCRDIAVEGKLHLQYDSTPLVSVLRIDRIIQLGQTDHPRNRGLLDESVCVINAYTA